MLRDRAIRGMVVIVIVSALCTGCSAANGAAITYGHSSATSLNVYSPFAGADISPSIVVTKTVDGSCWTSALTDWRSVAWRCFGPGAVIHDPCFSTDAAQLGFVVCPLYTPRSQVLRINLTKPLPKPASDTTNSFGRPPWALKLRSGVWCISRGGMNGLPTIAGKDVTYLCESAAQSKASPNRFGDAGMLLGRPHRSPTGWTILDSVGKRITRVSIDSAWW